jgi:ATP-dependent DNA helicase RecQ
VDPATPALDRLHAHFGFRQFLDGQEDAIGSVLAGRDVLVVMPTGGGKSLCYQLPALMLDGLTVVVSPLIALMKDQVDGLVAKGIPATFVNSSLTDAEIGRRLGAVGRGEYRLVYVAPERFKSRIFVEAVAPLTIALFAVDEAHCISQWGHDFRPAFLQIGEAAKALGSPPVLALTATATPQVIDDIRKQLRRPRLEVVNTGVYRPNLVMQVVQATSEDEKDRRLDEALSRAEGSGIVYTATVKAAQAVHARLLAAGESVALYHGKLRAAERHAAQDRFMNGEVRLMVATNAFGMGIDKPDIRFVLHYQMPGKLEAYLQEAGRAGRDGDKADCLLLFHRKDRQVQQFFLAHARPGEEDLSAVHGALVKAGGPLTLAALAEALPGHTPGRLQSVLARLRDGGRVRTDRQRRWRSVGREPLDAEALQALVVEQRDQDEHDREALERMVFYAQTGWCRWRVLLDWFGEAPPFEQHCGHCDNCLRPPVPPSEPDETAVPAEEAAATAAPRFAAGDTVVVPRHGDGRVLSVAGEEVEVIFPDGQARRFVADYVRRLPDPAPAG